MKTKKLFSLSLSVFLLAVAFMPSTQAARCTTDYDRDGYYVGDEASDSCGDTIGIKGYEPAICDCPVLKDGANCESVGGVLTEDQILELFDPNKVSRVMRGSSFNPKASDAPNDGIDQNCDGSDSAIGDDSQRSISDLIQTAVQFLSMLVGGVSTAFLIWGAIMYASAAGEEEKTRKARKTMVGAVIGLIIGILAYNIINIVIEQVIG